MPKRRIRRPKDFAQCRKSAAFLLQIFNFCVFGWILNLSNQIIGHRLFQDLLSRRVNGAPKKSVEKWKNEKNKKRKTVLLTCRVGSREPLHFFFEIGE